MCRITVVYVTFVTFDHVEMSVWIDLKMKILSLDFKKPIDRIFDDFWSLCLVDYNHMNKGVSMNNTVMRVHCVSMVHANSLGRTKF